MSTRITYKEVWKPVPVEGYGHLYHVSNFGEVFSVRRGKKLKPILTDNGYHRVNLYRDGKHKRCFVHRLVAMAFISNTENKGDVNHLDFNRTNNHISNLEWTTRQENINHSILGDRWANSPNRRGKEHWNYNHERAALLKELDSKSRVRIV